MAKQSPKQKQVIGRVMHEFRHGELDHGSGGRVKSPKQAVAIALSEAGASNRQSPKQNRRKRKQTEAREADRETAAKPAPTRQELYGRARAMAIPGRSHMSKAALQEALAQHKG